MVFTPEQIHELISGYKRVADEYEEVTFAILQLNLMDSAKEYAEHGFARRLKTLKRCIEQIYTICHPDRKGKPSSEELTDISIYLQSFVFNVFGAIDNLAWVWVKQNKISYAKNQDVRFSNPKVVDTLSQDFREYLKSLSDWFSFQEGFRHALAHRIPLYVPPFVVNDEEAKRYKEIEFQFMGLLKEHKFEEYEKLREEQDHLGKFVPWMGHSFSEETPQVVFHAQVLADWATVVEIARKFILEFR